VWFQLNWQGEPAFEKKARVAVDKLFEKRSRLHLLGNTLDADSGGWINRQSSAGAGVDSYYEYLLKAYLLLGDPHYLHMFERTYHAAMEHLPGKGQVDSEAKRHWLYDVSMDTGRMARPWVSSLQSFWPGMQVLIGHEKEATALYSDLLDVADVLGFIPELFDVTGKKPHPRERGYPLCPELIESTYFLYMHTRNGTFLEAGRRLQAALADNTRAACGYASVGDVVTGRLDDHMESFFLAETAKYLYLLWTAALDVPLPLIPPGEYVFTTEVCQDDWKRIKGSF